MNMVAELVKGGLLEIIGYRNENNTNLMISYLFILKSINLVLRRIRSFDFGVLEWIQSKNIFFFSQLFLYPSSSAMLFPPVTFF